jgi:two-component system phosphate regulon sensor histidine kinase PhoR
MSYEQKLFFLLVILVVIPCIVLATFSLQAILGQRELIEQKIKESYTALAYSIHKRVFDRVKAKENQVSGILHKQVWLGKEPAIPNLSTPLNDPFFKSVYVVDNEYTILYPKERPHYAVAEVTMLAENYNIFENAHLYEFQKNDFIGAIAEYQKIVAEEKGQKLETLGYALFAIARCQTKTGQTDKAMETYQYLATLFRDRSDPQGIHFLANAKAQIAGIYKMQKDVFAYYQTLLELFAFLFYNEYRLPHALYCYHSQMLTQRLSQMEEDAGLLAEEKGKLLEQRRKIWRDRDIMLAVETALNTTRKYLLPQLKIALEKRNANHGYLDYQIGSQHFLAYYQAIDMGDNNTAYVVYTLDLQYAIDDIILPILQSQGGGKDVWFTVIDREEKAVISVAPAQFFLVVSQSLSPAFPFWQVAVYLKNIRSLDELSRYRSQIYVGGLVVVVVILLIGIYITIATFVHEVKTVRMQSDFLSNISHELKTPLTSIKMFAETLLLERTRNKEEQKECLQIIAAETDRLRRLIDIILEFAKMKQHKKIFQFAPHDLKDLLQETVDYFKTQIPDKDKVVEMTVACEAGLPQVVIDREAMVEAITNLLSNAYKYNDKPHKKIEVSCQKFSANRVVIAVKDNGIGIPKQEQRRIFQKFYRIQNPQARHIEGTGLGLSLVESIVKAHHGKMKVQSKLGVGSEFSIVLPFNRAQA